MKLVGIIRSLVLEYIHDDADLIVYETIDGVDVDDDTLHEFIENFVYNETAQEQELDAIWDIVTLIIDNKNMYDNTYMFSNAVIGYFDQFGNGLT
jgi:hypothetical protein